MNTMIPHVLILMAGYPEGQSSDLQFTSFKRYSFACLLGIVLGRTPIGVKLLVCIKGFLEKRISGRKRLIALSYLPFILSLGVLAVFMIMRYNGLSNLLYVLSYIIMTVLFFVSNQWAVAIIKILQERKK